MHIGIQLLIHSARGRGTNIYGSVGKHSSISSLPECWLWVPSFSPNFSNLKYVRTRQPTFKIPKIRACHTLLAFCIFVFLIQSARRAEIKRTDPRDCHGRDVVMRWWWWRLDVGGGGGGGGRFTFSLHRFSKYQNPKRDDLRGNNILVPGTRTVLCYDVMPTLLWENNLLTLRQSFK